MADFAEMFAVGMIILIGLLVAFNVTTFVAPVQTDGKFIDGRLREVMFTEKDKIGAIFTGINFTDQFVPFNFAFEVDNLAEIRTTDIGSSEVVNGVLFGEKSVRYTLEKGDSVTVKFRIESTNALSPLIFKLNGKDHSYKLVEGIHEITIEEPFDEGSVLEITTASSNWQIWAPSLYRIEGLSINVKAAKEDIDQYIFKPQIDLDTVQGGRMDLYLKDNIGTLKVELNGKTIFDSISRDFQTIRFSKDDLKKGQNIFTFTAAPNSKFRGEATRVLFYKQADEKSITAIINLTQSEHDNMRKGTIKFKVVEVKEHGGLSVRISNRGETTFSEFARAETGFYTFDFTEDDVQPGISVLTVEQLDGASFLVKDLSVKIEKNWWTL